MIVIFHVSYIITVHQQSTTSVGLAGQ